MNNSTQRRRGYWPWTSMLFVLEVFVALTATTALLANDSTVARLIDCRMPVTLRHDKIVPVQIGTELHKGDTLVVSQGGSVTIMFQDGRIQVSEGPSEFVITAESKSTQSTIGKLASGLIDLIFPTKKDDGRARLAVRGEPPAATPSLSIPVLAYPPRGTMLMDAPDRLEWLPIDGALGYTVSLFDQNHLIWEERTLNAACAIPNDSLRLSPGEFYFWVVQSHLGSATLRSEQSSFGISDTVSRNQILTALREIDSLDLEPRVASLLRVSLYQNHELLLEEYREIDSLLKKQPKDYLTLIAKAQLCEAMYKYSDAVACYRQAIQQ